MLGISVLEDALRAEHFLVALAEELDLLVLMSIAILDAPTVLGCARGTSTGARVHLSDR